MQTTQGPVTDYNDDNVNYRSGLAQSVTSRGVRLNPAGKPMVEKRYTGYILPSFDYYTTNEFDTAFTDSVAPCWLNDTPDPKNAVYYMPTAWAIKLPFWLYHGPRGEHIISNRVLGFPGVIRTGRPELGPLAAQDAFFDLQSYIFRDRRMSRGEKDAYLKKPSLEESPICPNETTVYAMNTAGSSTDYPDFTNSVLLVKPSAHDHILAQLRWHAYADREERFQPLDPAYPNYVLGDVTNPARALPFFVQKVTLNERSVNTPLFSEQTNCRPREVRHAQLSAETLRNRVVLTDYNSWNWMPYEEQVALILESYKVPIEIIKAALGGRVHIPDRGYFEQCSTTYSHGAAHAGSPTSYGGPPVMSAIPGMAPLPPQVAPAPAIPVAPPAPAAVPTAPPVTAAAAPPVPAAAAPAPVVPSAVPVVPTVPTVPVPTEPKFAAGVPGGESGYYTKAQLQTLRQAHPDALVEATPGNWINLDEFLGAPASSVPAAPVPAVPSAVTPVPAASAQPTSSRVDEHLRTTFQDRLGLLTPAEQTRAREIAQEVVNCEAAGKEIAQSTFAELAALAGKAWSMPVA